jgi:TM2 domain-containing membrane protein YozV
MKAVTPFPRCSIREKSMPAADLAARTTSAPPLEYSFFAAFLSYLVPGLGQIYQGRVLKGMLFMVCLLGLFCYGMRLGSWSNVYLPVANERTTTWKMPTKFLTDVVNRLPFAGQMWIGVAAWPAILQYSSVGPEDNQVSLWNKWVVTPQQSEFWGNFQKTPPESTPTTEKEKREYRDYKGRTLNELQADGDKAWDLGWVYTVIAGVLNILVIYDAFAGAAFHPEDGATPAPKTEAVPV